LDTVDGNVQHGKVELYSTTRGRTRHNKIREAFCFAQHGYVQLNKIHSQSCETECCKAQPSGAQVTPNPTKRDTFLSN
jgi:hypothetical protein